jgi:hypothetical protein
MRFAWTLIVLVLGVGLILGVSGAEAGKGETFAKVEVKGTLKTGIVAIGGETTGTIIQAKDLTLELDFGKNEKLRDEAEKLNGKTAHVTGELTMRKGVTRGPRIVVNVATIKAAE